MVLTLTSGLALGQQGGEKEKDPFVRKTGKEQQQKADDPEKILVIGLQLAKVPSSHVRDWDEEGITGTEWRNRVQNLIEEGKAEIIDSVASTFVSGSRGKVQSVLELHHPTVFKKISETPGDPEFPKAFDTRNVGIYFEADPVLSADGDEVDLNFAFEWSRYLGEAPDGRTPTGRIQESDLISPMFSQQKITTGITMPVGEYRVLSRIKPHSAEERENFDVIVFARIDLVVENSFGDSEMLKKVGQLRLRGTWLEVDASEWHAAIHRHSLSQWFGGKAWEVCREFEKSGKAKVLASPVFKTGSGRRAKVEVGESLEYLNSFPVPGEEAEDSRMLNRNLGHTLEMDPVLATSGIIKGALAANSASLHGYSVSYRKLEGQEWIPQVQFPKFYESSVTTTFYLGKNANLLIAAGTQPLENGQPDTGKKWVFFLHNDTFDAQ